MTTITPHPKKTGYYLVQIEDGGLYEVCAATGACSCSHYVFRLADKPGEVCKHGQALADQLACNLCHGFGRIALRNRYAGEDPICILCDGSGVKADPLPSQEELLKMFA